MFGKEESKRLVSPSAVNTAKEAMQECSIVFVEIETTLKKSKRNRLGQLLLPFRDAKIELMRNHIDKLKSTLQLLMQVFSHAYQIASNQLDREVESRQREEIEQLLKRRDKSTNKYEQSLRNYNMSSDGALTDDDTLVSAATLSILPTGITVAAVAIGSTITATNLESCVHHVRSLLKDLEGLQQIPTNSTTEEEHSNHHEAAPNSYLRTRRTLDQVLCGSNPMPYQAEDSAYPSYYGSFIPAQVHVVCSLGPDKILRYKCPSIGCLRIQKGPESHCPAQVSQEAHQAKPCRFYSPAWT